MTPDILQQIIDQVTSPVTTPSGQLTLFSSLLVKAVIVVAVYFLARWLTRVAVRAMERAKLDRRTIHLAERILFYLLIGVVALWVMGGLGLTLLLLILVVSFSLSDVVQNVAAALTISATGFTRVGDWMVINGFEGTVISANWRGVVLETFDNRWVIISNVDVAKNVAVNYSRTGSLRRGIWVSIAPDANLAQAQRIIRESLAATNGILADPAPQVLVSALYGTAITLEVRLWLASPYNSLPQFLSDAKQAIHTALREHGIPLAVPVTMLVPADPGREVAHR